VTVDAVKTSLEGTGMDFTNNVTIGTSPSPKSLTVNGDTTITGNQAVTGDVTANTVVIQKSQITAGTSDKELTSYEYVLALTADVVRTAGSAIIDGLKTFNVLPQAGSTGGVIPSPTDPLDFTTKHYVDDTVSNANYVATSGNESVSGVKTFNDLPETSATPSTNNQFVNKLYVDTSLQNASSNIVGFAACRLYHPTNQNARLESADWIIENYGSVFAEQHAIRGYHASNLLSFRTGWWSFILEPGVYHITVTASGWHAGSVNGPVSFGMGFDNDGDNLAAMKLDSDTSGASDSLPPFGMDCIVANQTGTWGGHHHNFSLSAIVRHKCIFYYMQSSENAAGNTSYGTYSNTGTINGARGGYRGTQLTFKRLAVPSHQGTDQVIQTATQSGLGVLSGTSGSYTRFRPFNATTTTGDGPFFLNYT
jgi:hypothetical protein